MLKGLDRHLNRERKGTRRALRQFFTALLAVAAVIVSFTVNSEDVVYAASRKATGPAAEVRAGYMNGATVELLQSQSGAQMSSELVKTPNGSLIVVDGGRAEDKDHLVQAIQSLGGEVSIWLVTHPHDDHVGALTAILNENPRPIKIDRIVCSFLSNADYERGENQGRMANLTDFQAALANATGIDLVSHPAKGTSWAVGDDAKVTILNEPFYADRATFNNSSVIYRVDTAERRLLFVGDLSAEGASHVLETTDASELKADVLQMAHHGSGVDGAGSAFYKAVSPSVCLWPTPAWMWNADSDSYGVNALAKEMASCGDRKDIRCDSGDAVFR